MPPRHQLKRGKAPKKIVTNARTLGSGVPSYNNNHDNQVEKKGRNYNKKAVAKSLSDVAKEKGSGRKRKIEMDDNGKGDGRKKPAVSSQSAAVSGQHLSAQDSKMGIQNKNKQEATLEPGEGKENKENHLLDDFSDSDTSFDAFNDPWEEDDNDTSEDESREDGEGVSDMSFEILFRYVVRKKTEKEHDYSYVLELKKCPGLYEKYKLLEYILCSCEFGSTFDSFCHTLPRPGKMEKKFQNAMKKAKDMLGKCLVGSIQPIKLDAADFPSEYSKNQAETLNKKLMWKLKHKRRRNINREVHEDDEAYSDLSESDEEYERDATPEAKVDRKIGQSFPHSILYMISDGKTNAFPPWCGQIQCCVNPVSKTLSFLMYDYEPGYDAEIIDKIHKGISSPDVRQAILNELETFQCCRQLRMDIPLQNLGEMSVVAQPNSSVYLVYSKLKPPAKYYQRFVKVSADDRNNWTERQQFLPFEGQSFSDCSRNHLLVFAADVAEVSDILAQIVCCSPDMKISLEPKVSTVADLMRQNSEIVGHKDYQDYSPRSHDNSPRSHDNSHQQASVQVDIIRRNQILEILLKYNIITLAKFNEIKNTLNISNSSRVNNSDVYNCLGDLKLQKCFQDYINYKCVITEDLEGILASNLKAKDYCHTMDNLDMDAGKFDLNKLTVAEFLSNKGKNASVFYSFCRRCPEETMNSHHCKVCRSCMDWRDWHCPKCDKCSYGVSNPICEHCGYKNSLKGHFIIQPNSYFLKSLYSDGQTNKVKLRWKVKLSKVDVPTWKTEVKVKGHTKGNFSLMEYLGHDDLGLINLWNIAFGLQVRGPRTYVGCFFSEQFRKWVSDNYKPRI